ncbi:hypothetical protein BROUX41_003447 [Berkeleyomyces rouxiae]|uniref:uncharacterized protein n=1 Tax=Berkeleyomyces rouxiae TaxID=2035830 RepID=UPI003B7B8371
MSNPSEFNGQINRDGAGGWFASNKLDYSLDVVTLLAIIGEQSMADHAPAITATRWCYLPRLLPAPQAFLRPTRPTSLPHVEVQGIGVSSGVQLTSISVFADSLLGTSVTDMDRYAFHAVSIRHTPRVREQLTPGTKTMSRDGGAESSSVDPEQRDVESGGRSAEQRRRALASFAAGGRNGYSLKPSQKQEAQLTIEAVKDNKLLFPVLRTKPGSPLRILTHASFLMTIGALVAAILWKDGMGVIAIVIVGLSSSLMGFASAWVPQTTTLPYNDRLPSGDFVLTTRTGAFVYVECEEPVARELFSGTLECKYYVGTKTYQALMATATVLIMISVIFLGNCIWQMKVLTGAFYIVLNLAYWLSSMSSINNFWDLSRYETKLWDDAYCQEFKGIHPNTEDKCFTKAVWEAIRASGKTEWARQVLPKHKGWDMWLAEANEMLKAGNKDWLAVKAKNDIFYRLQAGGRQQEEQQQQQQQQQQNMSGY